MPDPTGAADNRVHVGLLWHSDRSRNLGVGALTVGDIAIVRQVAAELGVEPRFTIFMPHDNGRPYIDDPAVAVVRMNTRTLIDPTRYWRSLGDVDLMLDIGAGDSFTDIYPFKRFRMQALTKVLTVWRGVPLILAPQTIGPFDKPGYVQVARWVLRKSQAVVVRDDLSAREVRKLTPEITPKEAVDVAFALPWIKAKLPATKKIRVGVNVSGLLIGGGWTGRGEFGLGYDYLEFTERLFMALAARPDVEVHLICHVVEKGGKDDDSKTADEYARRYPAFIRVPDFESPSDAKGYISALDLLIGARMHATIGGFSSGTPVLPVSYSRKFEGLYGTLGYRWLIPHKGMGTEEALKMALEAIDNRGPMKADIATGMRRVEAKLDIYRQVLREAIAKARARRA